MAGCHSVVWRRRLFPPALQGTLMWLRQVCARSAAAGAASGAASGVASAAVPRAGTNAHSSSSSSSSHLRHGTVLRRHARTLLTDGRRLVLGIESSCDDSCASLVSGPADYGAAPGRGDCRATIHTSIVHKQDHGLTRGIEPLAAANRHSARLPLAIREALEQGHAAGLLRDVAQPTEIDAIAVTQGPGMAGCLAQGLTSAKLLSALWKRPLLHVHHMVAHTLTPLMTSDAPPVRFPFLVVLLSGGHTQVVLCSSPRAYRILSATTDNSIGDAFDKVARTLEIPFDWATTAPGAALEAFARPIHPPSAYRLPVPLKGKPQFSYSGLLVAVQRLVDRDPSLMASIEARQSIAHSFQVAAFAQIQDKIRLALAQQQEQGDQQPGGSGSARSMDMSIRDIVVSGGVASNRALRSALQDMLPLSLTASSSSHGRDGASHDAAADGSDKYSGEAIRWHFPPVALCTDNAAMIAHAGLLLWEPTFDLSAVPRAKWSLDVFGREGRAVD